MLLLQLARIGHKAKKSDHIQPILQTLYQMATSMATTVPVMLTHSIQNFNAQFQLS